MRRLNGLSGGWRMFSIRALVALVLCLLLPDVGNATTDMCANLRDTTLLCRLTVPNEVPLRSELLPERALSAISAFVATKVDGADPSGVVVDAKLVTLLPPDIQRRCVEAAGSFRNRGDAVALLCIRPACIEVPKAQRCEAKTQSFTQTDLLALEQLRKTALEKCTTPDSCFLSADAIELAVAADSLSAFALQYLGPKSWDGFCPEKDVALCSRRLRDAAAFALQQFSENADWHSALTELRMLNNSRIAGFLQRPEVVEFENAWLDLAAAVEAARADPLKAELYMLDANVQLRTSNVAAHAAKLIIASNDVVEAEQLQIAEELKRDIGALLTATGEASTEYRNIQSRFAELSRQPLARDALGWRGAARRLFELADDIERIKRDLQLNAANAPAFTKDAKACASDQPRFDMDAGRLELCYPPSSSVDGPQVTGLRFNFVPCPGVRLDCNTQGDLDLLWKVGAMPAVSRPLGLLEVASTVKPGTTAGLPVMAIRVRAPSYSFREDKAQAAAVLSELLPPPFKVTVRTLDLMDGPEVAIEFAVGMDFTGVQDTVVQLRLGRSSMTVDGRTTTDLTKTVREKVRAALTGRKIQFGQLELQLRAPQEHPQCVQSSDFQVSADVRFGDDKVGSGLLSFCAGKASLAIAKVDDRFEGGIKEAIGGKLSQVPGKNGVQRLQVFAAADRLRGLATVSLAGCTSTLEFDLASPIALQFPSDLASKAADCALEATLSGSNVVEIGKVGFRATDKPGVYCTESLASVGRLCATGTLLPNVRLNAELQNNGEAIRKLSDALAAVAGSAAVRKVRIVDNRIVATADVSFPGLGPVSDLAFDIAGLDIEKSLLSALRTALRSKIGELVSGGALVVAGAEIRNVKVKEEDSHQLEFGGEISYGGLVVPVEVQVLPTFKLSVKRPTRDLALKALSQLFGQVGISNITNIAFVEGAGSIPPLRFEVVVSFAPFGDTIPFKASAVVEARPGGSPRFAGPVSFTVPAPWSTVGYVAVGRIRARIDLNQLKDFTVGASLALAPGPGTYDLLGLDGDLRLRGEGIDLSSVLKVAGLSLGQATGQWRRRENMFEVTVGSSTSNILPIPSGRLVIDGQACALGGSASVKFLGAHLAQAKAGLLLALCSSIRPPRDALIAEIVGRCGDRGTIARLCLMGKVDFGIIKGTGRFSTRLDRIVPSISGEFDIAKLARFDAELSSARARLKANVIGIRLTVILPSVDRLNERFLRDLIESLLRPSIDLNALLNGKITIAPAAKGGKGDEAMATASSAPSEGGQKGAAEAASAGKPTPKPPVSIPSARSAATAGDYAGPPGRVILGTREHKPGSPYLQVTRKFYGEPYVFPSELFSRKDAEDVRKGSIVLFIHQHFSGGHELELADGSTTLLACHPWECSLQRVYAVHGYRTDALPASKMPPPVRLELDDAAKLFKDESGTFLGVLPHPSGMFAFPGIIKMLASRAQAKMLGTWGANCLLAVNQVCEIGLVRAGSLSLTYRGVGPLTKVDEQSLGRALLAMACPDTCDLAKGEAIMALSGMGGLVSFAPDGQLVVALHQNLWADVPTSRLNIIDPVKSSVIATWPVRDHSGFSTFSFWGEKVPNVLVEEILVELTKKVKARSQIDLSIGGETHVAALAADSTSNRIWSYVRQNGQTCRRSKPVTEVFATLQSWSKDGRVDAKFATKLVEPSQPKALLNALADPELREGEFAMSPLLLLGSPVCN